MAEASADESRASSATTLKESRVQIGLVCSDHAKCESIRCGRRTPVRIRSAGFSPLRWPGRIGLRQLNPDTSQLLIDTGLQPGGTGADEREPLQRLLQCVGSR